MSCWTISPSLSCLTGQCHYHCFAWLDNAATIVMFGMTIPLPLSCLLGQFHHHYDVWQYSSTTITIYLACQCTRFVFFTAGQSTTIVMSRWLIPSPLSCQRLANPSLLSCLAGHIHTLHWLFASWWSIMGGTAVLLCSDFICCLIKHSLYW